MSLEGERDGYPLVLEWIHDDESAATVCYATLPRNHPTSTLHRRPFSRKRPPHERFVEWGKVPSHARDVLSTASVDSWQLHGRHLAAIRREWVGPHRIETLIGEVVAASAAIDGAA